MKRLNINLYDDEYTTLVSKSKSERISMNKIIQQLIRDSLQEQTKQHTLKIINTKEEAKEKIEELKRIKESEDGRKKWSQLLGRYV